MNEYRSPYNEGFGYALNGGPKGIRTLDLSDANRTLSQLSYGPVWAVRESRATFCKINGCVMRTVWVATEDKPQNHAA